MAVPNKTSLNLERNGWEIDLSWKSISNSLGTKIERKREDESTYSLIATVSGGDTDFIDLTANINLSNVYRVKSFNADGDSAYSNYVLSDAVKLLSVYTYAVSGSSLDNFIVLEDSWSAAPSASGV